MDNIINEFEKEVIIEYKKNKYSVRDNGSIYRHIPENGKKRPLDEIWTFGKVDLNSGYLTWGEARIHQIVATAFLGVPPNKEYIVDHIDTNRQNNRPSNLRWVTKLENILLNPYTKNKIEWICGCSIEDVLKDITILRDKKLTPQFDWMKAVTKEEAAITIERLEQLRKQTKTKPLVQKNKEYQYSNNKMGKEYYPCLPQNDNPSLDDYFKNLTKGRIFFSKSYYGERTNFYVIDSFYDSEKDFILVKTETKDGIKNYYLTKITLVDGEFQYEVRSFFELIGLDKYFTLAKGGDWTGGDCLDDYC